MKEFLTDLEIASAASKNDITDIGNLIGIPSDALIPYGNDKAKVTYDFIDSCKDKKMENLFLLLPYLRLQLEKVKLLLVLVWLMVYVI